MKSRHASAAPASTRPPIAPRGRGLGAAGPADRLARAGHVTRGRKRFPRAQQRLGGDAGPVRALAADELALDDRDPQVTVDERTGAMLPGGPAAEDDDVVVVAHIRLLAAARASWAASARPVHAR